MKVILSFALLFISFFSFAQYDSTKILQVQNSYGYQWKNGRYVGSLIIPGDTVKMAAKDSNAIVAKGAGLYKWNGYRWIAITGAGGSGGGLTPTDTQYLRRDINTNTSQTIANAAAIQQRMDSLRNNAGVLEARKGGVFVPQFTLPTGGGGGATKTYSPLTVRNDTVFQKFNVLAYGAIPNDTLSDQFAIQAAINDAYAAGGGTVFFPNGKYYIKDSLVTNPTIGVGNPNAQLYIPYEPSFLTAKGAVSIKLLGETPPSPNASALGNYTINQSGVILYSTIQGTGYYPAIISSKGIVSFTDTISIATLTVENINLRVKANISASGPTMSALNLKHMAFVDLKNIVCDLDTGSNKSVYPIAETFGVFMPYQNNGAYSPINNVLVTGYKYGYIFSEHSTGNNINAIVNEHAFVFRGAPHPIHFTRLGAQWNKYSITGFIGTVSPLSSGLNPVISVDQLDIEYQKPSDYPSDWFSNRYIIYDSLNFLKGWVNYHLVKRNVGAANFEMSKLGGLNVQATPTQKDMITLTDGATITWNLAQSLSAKVTLAGNRTLAFTNPAANTWGQIIVVQDGTGSRTLTLPASFVIDNGAGAITLSPAAGSQDILTFFYDGTNYYWNYGKKYN